MSFKRGQLEYFVTVAEEGQMTRAAGRLHIAQPALSQAISQLENELGIALLHRHARGVTLTAAGEIFLAKARVALAATLDAAATAQSLARAATGSIKIGYIGPPPAVSSPILFSAFADAHPEVDVSYSELPFPLGPTGSWLSEVDVAISQRPESDRRLGQQLVRVEPRSALLPEHHPLAGRETVTLADLLDDIFIGYHPSVQEQWAGYHSFDDHRGGPPRRLTSDRAMTPAEMLLMLASRRAVTTLPASDARVITEVLRGVVAVPVTDADPFEIVLSWRTDNHNPLVQALVAQAANLGCEEPWAPGGATNAEEFGRVASGLDGKIGDRRRAPKDLAGGTRRRG
jgi:DNA-binding transcriptional LysR family regulator